MAILINLNDARKKLNELEGSAEYNKGVTDAFNALFDLPVEAEPYIEFCKWVTDTILPEDFEDKWTLGAFAEVACRKLHKLGLVHKEGEYWTMDEAE